MDKNKKMKFLLKPHSIMMRHGKVKKWSEADQLKVEWLNKLAELGLLAACEVEPELVNRC